MTKFDPKARRRKGLLGGIIGFGAAFGLYALLPFPLAQVSDFLLAGGVSLAAGGLIGVMAQGPDLRSIEEKNRAKAPPVRTGDEKTDALFMEGRRMLEELYALHKQLKEEAVRTRLDQICRGVQTLFDAAAKETDKAPKLRRFMDYYLPTTLKLCRNWQEMHQRGAQGPEAEKIRRDILEALDAVVLACQKQLEHLYKEDYLDISTDIDVLQQLLRRDGLTETTFTPLETPRHQEGGHVQ